MGGKQRDRATGDRERDGERANHVVGASMRRARHGGGQRYGSISGQMRYVLRRTERKRCAYAQDALDEIRWRVVSCSAVHDGSPHVPTQALRLRAGKPQDRFLSKNSLPSTR
jgi:hypothetical protein